MPILNGIDRDEERIFVTTGVAVSGGTFVLVGTVTAQNYQERIGTVLGVPDARAAAIAAEYPLDTYASPAVAFGALVGDANFACTALQQDEWTSRRVPTFA